MVGAPLEWIGKRSFPLARNNAVSQPLRTQILVGNSRAVLALSAHSQPAYVITAQWSKPRLFRAQPEIGHLADSIGTLFSSSFNNGLLFIRHLGRKTSASALQQK